MKYENFLGIVAARFALTRSKRRLNGKTHATETSASRKLRLEALENRELLAADVLTGAALGAEALIAEEYDAIRAAYPALELPETVDKLNVIEIDSTNITVEALKAAIAEAGTTEQDDLIVVRTTDDANAIVYSGSSDKIIFNVDSSAYGVVNIVALGTQPLTIDAARNSRVLRIDNGKVGLANLTITAGRTDDDGGGVYVGVGCALTAVNSTISDNSAYDGGGVYVGRGCAFTSTRSTISNNSADSACGGGVCCIDGTFTATNSTIFGNSSSFGGGVYAELGTFTSTNSLIVGNSAGYDGGGVCFMSGTFTSTNSTITGNSTGRESGGGGVCYITGLYTSTNSILSLNYGTNLFSDLSPLGKNNLIDEDPLFVCAPEFDDSGVLVNGDSLDLRLLSGSPAIDKGDNQSARDAGLTVDSIDMSNKPRFVGSAIDIGAYEYQGDQNDEPSSYSTVVDALNDSFDPNDGEWSLREAIYYAKDNATITFADNLSGTLALTLGELVVDKALAIDGDGRIAIDADGKSRVALISAGAPDAPVLFKGLTLRNGKAENGGGVCVANNGVFSLTDSTISGNSAYDGGGVYVASNGTFTSTNSTIADNSAESYGGGVLVDADGTFTSTNSTISNNLAEVAGGVDVYGTFTLTNSTISDNSALYGGGGVYVDPYGTFTSTNSTISGNSAAMGGGVYVHEAFTSTNSTIFGNSAELGGGVYVYKTGRFTSTNSTIYGNSAFDGGGVYVYSDGTFTSTNSTISGNSAAIGGGVYVYPDGTFTSANTILSLNCGGNLCGELSDLSVNNLIDYFPLFVCAPEFDENGNLTNAADLDLRLRSDSLVIDAGSNAFVEGITADLDGNDRIYNGTVDIGAYEYQGDRTDAPFYSTIVNTSNDSFDLNDGEWSLREAIYYASNYVTITFADNLSQPIKLTLGELVVDKALAIDGGGRIVIDADGKSRVATISVGTTEAPVVFKGLTLQNGKADNGGGVYVKESGTFTLTNSTISGNSADYDGGGVCVIGTFTLTNSTISGNSAFEDGGGVDVYGTFTSTNSTISGNSAEYEGGGVYVEIGGTFTASNSILSSNYGDNLDGELSESSTNNLIDDAPLFVCAPEFDEYGSLLNRDSLDLRLRSNSPAIDQGDDQSAYDAGLTVDSTDMAGGLRFVGAAIDIGAYEFYSTVVDTLNDSFDPNDGEWSLREAIYYARDYVTITFADNLSGTLALTLGELVVDKALAIDGDGRIAIDADGASRVARISAGAPDTPVLFKGLTLQNGKADYGGGVYVDNGTFTSMNSTISGNSAEYDGGGVFVGVDGTFVSTDSTISGNSAEFYGGGVEAYGTFTLTNSTISDNSAESGGGVDVYGLFAATNSTISDNWAEYEGGGVFVDNGDFVATNLTIADNLAGGYCGGGVYLAAGTFTSTNSRIVGNSAASDGGGVEVYSGTFTSTNTTISGNLSAYGNGGGVDVYSGTFVTTNTTISGNSATNGGGVYVDSFGTFTSTNSILSLNYGGNLDGELSASSKNNLVGDDPSFICAPEFDDAGVLLNRDSLDLRLRSNSPAIDQGDDQSAYDAGLTVESTDMAGGLRFVGAAIDIGAYEFNSTVVDALNDSFDPNDGEWSLREAIYYAPDYATITFADNLSGTLALTLGELVVDKALAIDGDGRITIDASSASRVARISTGAPDAPVLFKGLTLQNGKADYGGGVYVKNGALTVTNATISGNSAESGGGVYVYKSGSFTSTDSTISGNSATNGGGVYVYKGGSFTASDSTFDGNSAVKGGGVYVYNEGSFTSTDSIIAGNSADYGGGVYLCPSGIVATTNSTISGNSAESGGGVYVYKDGAFTSTNSTIFGNTATNGGGVYVYQNGVFTASDSTLSDNSASYGGGVYVYKGGSFTASDSTFDGNSAVKGGGVYVYNEGSFTSTNSVIVNNYADYGGGVYLCPSGIVTSTNSTISGNSAKSGGGVYVYKDGVFTASDSTIFSNSATNGGGVYVYQNGVFTASDSTFSDNSASYGGGVYVYKGGSFTASDSTFDGNSAVKGGGVYVYNEGSFTSTNSIIVNNSADYGGGVYLGYSGIVVATNSTISGNSAKSGGSVYVYKDGAFTSTNSTIFGNSASRGGGVYVYDGGSFTSTNLTISGNSAKSGGGVYVCPNGAFVASNSILSLNYGADLYGDLSPSSKNNLIDEDPLFVCAPEFDGFGVLLNDDSLDLRLRDNSPAINQGDNQSAYDAGLTKDSTDAAGGSRFVGSAIDIGAYEYQSVAAALALRRNTQISEVPEELSLTDSELINSVFEDSDFDLFEEEENALGSGQAFYLLLDELE